jgi:hypothetical protein
VLAFSKLAGDKDIPGFIGPTLSGLSQNKCIIISSELIL